MSICFTVADLRCLLNSPIKTFLLDLDYSVYFLIPLMLVAATTRFNKSVSTVVYVWGNTSARHASYLMMM